MICLPRERYLFTSKGLLVRCETDFSTSCVLCFTVALWIDTGLRAPAGGHPAAQSGPRHGARRKSTTHTPTKKIIVNVDFRRSHSRGRTASWELVQPAGRPINIFKMTKFDSIVKPKSKRAKRFLERRAPKLTEDVKTAMIMKGGNSSLAITQALKDIYALKKPNAVLFKKKNITRPFEDSTSLEFFSKKSDCSLFLFGSHSKKRPNNLIFGRLFDFHVLDMIELGIEKYISLRDIKSSKCPEGTKPMLVFAGDAFDTNNEYRRLKSLFIDFFRGPAVSAVRLAGLEHVLHFTALEGKIYIRSYRSLLKKSGCRTPRIELEEIGPSFDLLLRRTHLASDDLFKFSHRRPKALQVRKKKNISRDSFGTKFGRVHMQKQDLSKLQTRKMKGLRKRRGAAVGEDKDVSAPKVANVEN
ncbi:ribosome production factor 2 homolog [Spinachia spinachia]